MVELLFYPFTSDPNAVWYILMAFLVSLPCALLGCFLTLRKMALIGDAISHSALPGIVIAFLIVKDLSSPWLLIGATISGIAVALLIELIHTKTRIKQDAAIGISFTTLFALGILLVSVFVSKQTDLHVDCIISGDLSHLIFYKKIAFLGLQIPQPIIQAGIIATLFVIGFIVFLRVLTISSFDSLLAVTLGIKPKVVHFSLMTILSLLVVNAFQSVGAILVIALLIIPASAAFLCTHRLSIMLLLSVLHALLSAFIGLYLNAFFHCSYSSAIVVAGLALLLLAWLFGPVDGALWKWKNRLFLKKSLEDERATLRSDKDTI
ncbi:metal ABC transporter permease [Akkermansiaceae bacterium]|nr:metal ABC transporter permease [Akkermansiaceae bacterium]